MIINVPTKIWRPKVINRYTPPDYNTDIDEGIFEYASFGNCVYNPCPNTPWEDHSRTDIIEFDPTWDTDELHKHFNIGTSISPPIKQKIIDMIKRHWDTFCSSGCLRPIIGYKFAIDTGTSTPVCKSHAPHISHIIYSYIQFISIYQYHYSSSSDTFPHIHMSLLHHYF